MNYTVHELAALARISERTLRYYDQLGLLRPQRQANGYRLYGPAQVDRLQQILFYRELGMELKRVAALLNDPAYDRAAALQSHLAELEREQRRLAELAQNVRGTLAAMKGEQTMTDEQKFEGMKQTLIEENERRYGAEIREKYGKTTVDACNARMKNMTEAQWQKAQALSAQLAQELRAAVPGNDPAGAAAQQICALHRDWLCCYWAPGMYSKAAHAAMGRTYAADDRFRAYYEAICPGAADYLCRALELWCAAAE